MSERNNNRSSLDRSTNASIRKAIGDRLQRAMGQEEPMPGHLQRLIDALQRQDKTA